MFRSSVPRLAAPCRDGERLFYGVKDADLAEAAHKSGLVYNGADKVYVVENGLIPEPENTYLHHKGLVPLLLDALKRGHNEKADEIWDEARKNSQGIRWKLYGGKQAVLDAIADYEKSKNNK